MQRTVFITIAVVSIAIASAVLTEFTLSVGQRGTLSDGIHRVVSTSPSSTPTPTVSVLPKPSLAPVPTLTPPPVPASTPQQPMAVTNGFVHLRSGATTDSAIVANLDGGTTVILDSYVDSQWQQVTYNGQPGYIYKSYLNY